MSRQILFGTHLVAFTVCVSLSAQSLPGTQLLRTTGDLASQMVFGMHQYALKETERSVQLRQSLWSPDFSSQQAYERSVTQNRDRFRKIIGLRDSRIGFDAPSLDVTLHRSALVGMGAGFEILAVRWPVLNGVDAEGLLLRPHGLPRAQIVALPDADWTPEALVGLSPGNPAKSQFARRFAENGCLVLIPVLIDRQSTWSGNPEIRFTNQPHREFIYRMAYPAGRHIIGYEVQKVLAAVDWFSKANPETPIGVIGYGEGGLIAFYSAAADARIKAACVSGFFQSRQGLWQEPIYRNLWGFLREFGDAEVAGLIAPRGLVIEACRHPELEGPPPPSQDRSGAAPGRLTTPLLTQVQSEFERAKRFFLQLKVSHRLLLTVSAGGRGQPGSEPALVAFWRTLTGRTTMLKPGPPPRRRNTLDSTARLHRQFDQLVQFTQAKVHDAANERRRFWSKADKSSTEKWLQSTKWYRDYFWEELIGRLPVPSEKSAVLTRKKYDEATWSGHEVVLPIWPDVFAYGVLLLPKDIKPGEQRPIVVCQHGLEGRAQDLIEPTDAFAEDTYQRLAVQLVKRGFIAYAPQNPYIGGNDFRQLQRKLHPLKLSLFSFVLAQNEKLLDWLSALPFVDPDRIGFYGLSYGGVTAVRVPPLLQRYALSICSANFNEWIWKCIRYDQPGAYLFSGEYEMFEFDLANTFNYAELASLMAPRPFMIERGHLDPVAPDENVAYEQAKARQHYLQLGIPGNIEIEFFEGGHVIHGEGTFKFLHRHLKWPEP